MEDAEVVVVVLLMLAMLFPLLLTAGVTTRVSSWSRKSWTSSGSWPCAIVRVLICVAVRVVVVMVELAVIMNLARFSIAF